MIAAEYGWTLDQILALTISQLNLLVGTICERKRREAVLATKLQRLAIVSSFSKDGDAEFNRIVSEMEEESNIIVVKPQDLVNYGLEVK